MSYEKRASRVTFNARNSIVGSMYEAANDLFYPLIEWQVPNFNRGGADNEDFEHQTRLKMDKRMNDRQYRENGARIRCC